MAESGALHFKHRPGNLDEIVGNEAAVESIKTIFNRPAEALPRTWLLTGPSGTGKTTIARIIKDMVDCDLADYHEYNAANSRGLDTARDISNNARMSPMGGKSKVYLLDEFHQFTGAAQEALLKILEDTPKNTFFILATTEPGKLKKSIKTRCTPVQLQSLTTKHIKTLLNRILKAEEVEDFPKNVITEIANNCEGSPREAVKILDTVIDIEDDEKALEIAKQGTASEKSAVDLYVLIYSTGKNRWPEVAECIKGLTAEPESVRRGMLTFLKNKSLKSKKLNPRIGELMECFSDDYFATNEAGLVLSCMNAVMVED